MLSVRHPDSYLAERAYIFGVVLGKGLGLDWSAAPADQHDVTIALAEHAGGPRLVLPDGLFATPENEWLAPGSLPPRPLPRRTWNEETIAPTLVRPDLPVLFGAGPDDAPLVTVGSEEVRLGIDVFGSIFFQLTRYEEIVQPARDEHERFPVHASLADQEGFLDRPLVDEYVAILEAIFDRLWPRLPRRRRAFKERLSHDVDWPIHPSTSLPRVVKAAGGDLLRRRDPGLAGARMRATLARVRGRPADDPYYAFDYIMDLSDEHGLVSQFNFMAGRTHSWFDGTYRLDEPWIGALIRRIHDRGHEIGIHPSYGTFRDPAAIKGEFERLLATCDRLGVTQDQWGGRQHFLRWENPVTWRAWEDAGLAHDSSLGYPRNPGFRCGTCREYPVFDLIERRELRLRERPLVVMEMAVIDRGAEHNGFSIDTIALLRERCRMFGGEFTLLWHNSRLASRRERSLYQASL
jgi:Family of unknown function (DUF7033)